MKIYWLAVAQHVQVAKMHITHAHKKLLDLWKRTTALNLWKAFKSFICTEAVKETSTYFLMPYDRSFSAFCLFINRQNSRKWQATIEEGKGEARETQLNSCLLHHKPMCICWAAAAVLDSCLNTLYCMSVYHCGSIDFTFTHISSEL